MQQKMSAGYPLFWDFRIQDLSRPFYDNYTDYVRHSSTLLLKSTCTHCFV